MIVAVLCPGPSLMRTWPAAVRSYDVKIGINRAVLAVRCDWWSIMDRHVLANYSPDYPIKFYIGKGFQYQHSDAPKLEGRERVDPEQFGEPFTTCRYMNDDGRVIKCGAWNSFSTTRAIVAAAWHQRAAEIDIYGADMMGVADYDGFTCPADNRKAARWAKERAILDQTIARMIGDETLPLRKVTRMTPDGPA